MKLVIFKEEKAEPKVSLSLVKGKYTVMLCAVDETGKPLETGTLLIVNPDGTFTRPRNVSKELGFKIDGAGRIELSDVY